MAACSAYCGQLIAAIGFYDCSVSISNMPVELMSVKELRDILENGRDSIRVPVKDVAGLFILRFPAMLGSPACIAVELNPARRDGSLMKDVGTLISSREDLEYRRKYYANELARVRPLVELLSDARLERLLEALEIVNRGEYAVLDRLSMDEAGISVEGLREILEWGGDWVRFPVRGAPGLFVVKVPASPESNMRERLALELNPLEEDGTPAYRVGYLLYGRESLQYYRRFYSELYREAEECLKILSHPGIDRLVENLEEVNRSWAVT